MRIIISPAKKMKSDTDNFAWESLPQFLKKAEQLKAFMQAMPSNKLQALWGCSDTIAKLNIDRLEHMNLKKNLTPALFSYEGLQYQYMAPDVLEQKDFFYLNEHLRILSGFYGLLRPFDGVTPYRLEMQARLDAGNHKNLYAFWGSSLADALCAETEVVVNLASKEYSDAVRPYLPEKTRFITCVFAQRKGDKLVEKGTFCKMARGQMVRFMAQNNLVEPEQIKAFSELSYRFSAIESDKTRFVFIKEDI